MILSVFPLKGGVPESITSTCSEINDFKFIGIFRGKHDILWFQISMHDFIGMAISHC